MLSTPACASASISAFITRRRAARRPCLAASLDAERMVGRGRRQRFQHEGRQLVGARDLVSP